MFFRCFFVVVVFIVEAKATNKFGKIRNLRPQSHTYGYLSDNRHAITIRMSALGMVFFFQFYIRGSAIYVCKLASGHIVGADGSI